MRSPSTRPRLSGYGRCAQRSSRATGFPSVVRNKTTPVSRTRRPSGSRPTSRLVATAYQEFRGCMPNRSLRLEVCWLMDFLLSSEVKHQSRRTAPGDANHHVLVRGTLLLVEDRVTVVHVSLDDLRLACPTHTLQARCEHADPRLPNHIEH